MSESSAFDELFDEGDALSARGAQALQAGEAEEGRELFRLAIAAYEQSLAILPPGEDLVAANLRLCIGGRRAGLGETDEALAVFDAVARAMEAREDLAENADASGLLAQARLNRADCLSSRGEVAEARRLVDVGLEEHPEHPYGVFLRERMG